MPTRNVVLTEHHATVIDRLVTDAVKLEALRDAAKVGFGDLDDGRFTDIGDEALDDDIGDLGRRAETSRP